MTDKLDAYTRKRHFNETPEPSGVTTRKVRGRSGQAADHPLSYVIQEHDARNLHYDFRLELDGTLKSWAVPKGPSLDPSVKRLAVHVEDHPLEYGSFEGQIPEGNYGAGSVIVWDRGTWAPLAGSPAGARAAYQAGKLKFTLAGVKLHGGWMLVRSHMRGSGDKEQCLLIKERDDEARSETGFDVLKQRPGSVLDGAEAGPATAIKKPAVTKVTKVPAKRAKKSIKSVSVGDSKKTDLVATRTAGSLRMLAASPSIEGAKQAPLPTSFKPQLATLVDSAPAGDEWSYEIKFDGYRVLVRIDRHAKHDPVSVFTRAGNNWTAKFDKQIVDLAKLDIDTAWLDGEAVVLDRNGLPSFQALQNAFDADRPQDIVFYLFDLPYLNGYDLRDTPLVQRRAILHALLDTATDNTLRFSDDFAFTAEDLLKSACDMALEGIVGKRRDSAYASGRTSSWIKLKCRRRQEFVIGGYTEPAGSRAQFGALLLGVYDAKGKLNYAGRVGSGFDAKRLRSLKQALDARETTRMPFARAPRERSRTPVHWVEPTLVAECNFAEWTGEQIVRQASFVSLRDDKPARQIIKEAPRQGADVRNESMQPAEDITKTPKRASAKKAPAKQSARAEPAETTVAGVEITHPERVIDKRTGTRKIDIVRYYASVADWILPHLKDRPVSLVRAPEDIGGELFFQKHSQKLSIPNVTQHPGLDPGHPPLITLDNVEALAGAAQMGTIELHTWNARVSNIEKPDRMVFDLDPDTSLGWDRMIEAAQLTRSLLEALGLESFCKTSGGKGFHVVVPLVEQAGWDEVKAFSQAVAKHMAATLPTHFSAKMGPQNRKQKIFVDYLRNNRGSSTVAAYSVRARPGLGVSVPLTWDEVPGTTAGDQWTVANLHERLDALQHDPWGAWPKARQRITAGMKKRLESA